MEKNKPINLTPEQAAAVNHDCLNDGSVIISAAAGSGKTFVLVEHIIKLICDTEKKIPADKIVTVTFTKKAAAEIRTRLEKRLSSKIAEAKGKSDWLNEQLIRLDEACISTISAFCLDIIRAYATESGLSPGFRNLDETEADEFMARALENTLEKLYDANYFSEEERTALDMLTGEIGDSALSVILRNFHETAVKQAFPDEWLDNLCMPYKNADKDIFGGLLFAAKEVLIESAELFARLCEESQFIAAGTKFHKTLENDMKIAADWKIWAASLNEKTDAEQMRLTLKNLISREFDRASYGKDFNEEELETLKKNRKECKKLAEELGEWAKLLFSAGKTNKILYPAVTALIKLYKMLAEEYSLLKLSANSVDFNDMERLCLNLLKKENGRYAEEIGGRFYEIIVDEFQDSNGLQYAIFSALKNGGGLYFVGDIKQSIYRFRNADPRVFGAVLNNPAYKTLYLNRNFRSGKEVTDAVNGIFSGLMTKELGGIDYDEKAMLVFGRDEAPAAYKEDYSAELCLIKINNPQEENADEDVQETNVKQAEACYIAKRIKEMVNGKFLIKDGKGKQKPCGYGDFAVIISALKTVEDDFIAAFEAKNIPVERGGSGDYLKLGEVGLVMDLLKVIDNPYSNDLSAVSILLSPVYGMNLNSAALIKAYGRSKSNKNIRLTFFDCIKLYAADKNGRDNETYKKAAGFIEDIIRFRAFAENNTPSRLIRRIYDEGLFLPLIAGAENSFEAEKINANLKLLLYYADNLSGFTGLDIKHLSGFIRFLSDKAENGKKLSEADNSSGRNAVKLLTIHASKGLEFPVCFVARLNSAFNKQEISEDVIFDDEAIAARYIENVSLKRYDSLSHRLAKNRITQNLLSEEMRKLYVAVTRAADKLILVGAGNTDQKSGEIKIKQNTTLNWITKSKAADAGVLKIIYPEVVIPDSISGETEIKETSVDENEKNNILEALNAVYSRTELTLIPKKLTATQIGVLNSHVLNGDESDEPSVFPRYPSFLKEKKLTGKKRGDCYHKLMRLLSFEAGDYANQIYALEERFTKEEFKAIDIPKITAFFESGLGKRAVKSHKVCKEIPLYTELSFTELYGCFSDNPDERKGKELDAKFSERPFIQGVADMFFYEDGGIVLVDYKTNRRPTKESLSKEYKNQLLIYKKAIEEMTGNIVKECFIYSFEIGEILV